MNEQTPYNRRIQEREEQKMAIEHAVASARPLLIGSHLFETGAQIDDSDVAATMQAIRAAFPVSQDNYRVHAHLSLASRFGGEIAQKIGLNKAEMEVLMWGHDLGRFVTNRYLRNDLVAGQMLSKLGIRRDLVAKMPSSDPPQPTDFSDETIRQVVDGMSVEEKIITIADFCGKRDYDNWGIRTFDEVMKYHLSSRDPSANPDRLFPSERRLTMGKTFFAARLYERIKAELFEINNIDVNTIRNQILADETDAVRNAVIIDSKTIPAEVFGNISFPGYKVVALSRFGSTDGADLRAATNLLGCALTELNMTPMKCVLVSENGMLREKAEKLGMQVN